MGFPMAGAGCGTGEGDLLVIDVTAIVGLRGFGGTTGGGVSLVWGLLTLMLSVDFAFPGVAWTVVAV